jgi:acetoacetate decarboxylase
MKESEVRSRAFAMPLTSPAYPIGPYRFCDREYLIITYRTDPKKLRELVPEPLQLEGDVVKFEFIRMPDSTGFGDYTESGQVIPVSFQGRKGAYTHCMFLNDHPPIAGGRELWGFPKKLAQPTLKTEIDTLVGRLHYGLLQIAVGAMGYKHQQADLRGSKRFAGCTQFPAQDHTACRRHGAHLRTRRIPSGGHRFEGRLDRAGATCFGLSPFGASGRVSGT